MHSASELDTHILIKENTMDKIVTLSITKKNVPVRVDVVQYATAPNIVFALDDFTPRGTAEIYIEKPSGMKVFSYLTIEDNRLTLVPTTQAFAEVGISKAQLLISDGTADAISFLIFFYVTENIIDSSAIESQDEFTALQEALNTVGQYDGRITALEGDVSGLEGDVSTIEGKVSTLETDVSSIMANGITTIEENESINEAKSKASSASFPVGLLVDSNKGIFTGSFGVDNTMRLYDNGNNELLWEHKLDKNETIYNPNGSTAIPSGSVASETWTNIGSFELPKAGVYLIMLTGRFDKNGTGVRSINISDTSASSSGVYNSTIDVRNAIATGATHMAIVHTINASNARTLYLNAWQNSGSTLTFNPRLAVIRLS